MREYRELMEQQRAKEVRMTAAGLVVVFLCIVAALIARALFSSGSEPAPTATLTATAASATLTAVLAPLPTNTPAPPPTDTPTPTATPLPTPVSQVSPSDPQTDVLSYDTLAPASAERIVSGVDIRAASIAPDLRIVLQTTEGVPSELSGWAEDQARFWIALYDPVPDPPTAYTEWLFVLDLDGNIETGRPAGSLHTNPDLGIEVAIGVYYDPAIGGYETYSLAWDPAQGNWADGPAGMQFTISDSRNLIGMALPLDSLTQSVAQITGVTLVPDAVRGRAAALATVGERIIDFCPDRPD
jgi:hypothetical protein